MGIMQGISFIILGIFLDLVLYFIINAILGYTTIILYAISLKMILEKNEKYSTAKFSIIYQRTLGLSLTHLFSPYAYTFLMGCSLF